jgi:hypothetical protein
VLDLSDVLELPRGVRHEPGRLVDDVSGVAHPTNATADAILVLGRVRLCDAVTLLVERFRLPPEEARRDVLAFAHALNAAGLANVACASRIARARARLLALVLGALLGRVPPAPVRRLPVRTVGRSRGVLGVVAALAPRAGVLALVGALLLLVCGAVVGAASPGIAAVVAVSLGASLVLHEAAHVAAVAPRPCALLLVGRRTSVLHAPVPGRRGVVVALAGPVLLGMLGLVLAVWAVQAASFVALLAACPPAGHVLAATVASVDGRLACGLEGV